MTILAMMVIGSQASLGLLLLLQRKSEVSFDALVGAEIWWHTLTGFDFGDVGNAFVRICLHL